MGKISNNLITEKALRATRVNKAIENFIKAHGGKFTIMSPYTVPEHIAYTASITSPSDYSRNGNVGVSRKVLKYTPGKGTGTYTTSMFDKDASRYVANALNKATGHDKEMSGKHFKETSTEPASNSIVKNSVGNKLKNSKVGNWLKNTKVGGYFTDSPLTPRNVALTYKGWTGQANPVAYAANAYGMGSGGGYMPVGEHTVDQLRIQHHPEDLSSFGTAVPINDEGTLYINPDTGATSTDIKIGSNGEEYYRVSPDKPLYKPVYGSGEAIEEDALNSLKDTHISADQLARNNIAKAKIANFNKTADYLNDIISGVIKNIPQDISKLPLPPMSADTTETKSTQPTVGSVVKPPRRVTKPPVVNNTPGTPVVNTPEVPTSNVSAPVAAPTLSSVVPQAVRHNGGFDNYRRESVLSALRAAGGISPAEAVQRGIIPWEALNYV